MIKSVHFYVVERLSSQEHQIGMISGILLANFVVFRFLAYRLMADKLLSWRGCVGVFVRPSHKISIVFLSETISLIDFKFGLQLPCDET